MYELKAMVGLQLLEMLQKYAHLDNDHLHAHAAKIDSLMQIACQKKWVSLWWVVRGSNPGQMD